MFAMQTQRCVALPLLLRMLWAGAVKTIFPVSPCVQATSHVLDQRAPKYSELMAGTTSVHKRQLVIAMDFLE